jgi:hypothetical protein
MLGKAMKFVNSCSISIEIKWIEVLAVPLPYFAWVKISPQYKYVLIIGMLIIIAVLKEPSQ